MNKGSTSGHPVLDFLSMGMCTNTSAPGISAPVLLNFPFTSFLSSHQHFVSILSNPVFPNVAFYLRHYVFRQFSCLLYRCTSVFPCMCQCTSNLSVTVRGK